MITRTTLHALCRRVGLAPAYENYWGDEQRLDDDQLVRLLRAMDIDARDEASAEAALAARADDTAAWPAVQVVRQSAPGAIAVPLSPASARRWHLVAEGGEQWHGPVEADGHGAAVVALPDSLPLGYHRLELVGVGDTTLIVCPDRCHEPAALKAGERWWGPALQLYALRSGRNWGIGDFTDLADAVSVAAAAGASFVGLNPLHALFPHDPERATPYSPSNRSALNPLYLDVEALPEFAVCEVARQRVGSQAFQQRLQALRDSPVVRYADVAAAKHEVLETVFTRFRDHLHVTDSPRVDAFRAFQRRHAAWLRPHALFDALQARQHADDAAVHGWRAWPSAWQDAGSEVVATFEREHLAAVEFHEYLQWVCDEQLAAAAARADAAGMPIGLYRDAAVGVDAGGSDTWQRPDLYALDVSVGAPPETHNPAGQSWGLPPMRPEVLRRSGHMPFADVLRANMRHAGALRLDHVMALCRLFWVPAEGGAAEGTYVSYPFEALLNILALESVRQQCLVIGEDLGNVPPGFREALAERGVRSYGPLYFQHGDDGTVPAPGAWPAQALAVVGTHDLPTLRSWWAGGDIATRARLGLYRDEDQQAQQAAVRVGERAALNAALVAAGASDAPLGEAFSDALVMAVHTFIGGVRSELVGVQLEDILGQAEPVNVPSTTEAQHPNWRVKLPVTLDALSTDTRWLAATRALAAARRGPVPQVEGSPRSLDVPQSTYRVQLHAAMRFDDVARAVPYLDALGISHLYASPYLKARAGSTHGYDVVDPSVLNPEIGDDAAHERLCAALRARGMGQLLDIVPNHMGVLQADNPWWLDVLRNGRASLHADTFDIAWDDPVLPPAGKLLLPVLGTPYAATLVAGELVPGFDAGSGRFAIAYHDHRFPLDPRGLPDTLAAVPLPSELSDDDRADLVSMLGALRDLPSVDEPSAAGRARRRREVPRLERRLAAMATRPVVRDWIGRGLARLAGQPGHAASFDPLHALLDRQAWRLAFWRVGGDDVNYRRFFDVTDLAAVQMDRAAVFEASHARILGWLADGSVTGLRVDHPDGLADPRAYFERLQRRQADVRREAGLPHRPLYVAVEKILADDEALPADWPVHGDTGYRFSNDVNGLFVDMRHADAFDRIAADFAGQTQSFDAVLREAKLLVMSTSLRADLRVLVAQLEAMARHRREYRDITRPQWQSALREVAAGFTVYRSYIGPRGLCAADRRALAQAAATAKLHTPADGHATIDALCEVLLSAPLVRDAPARRRALRFVARWQQFTAPVQAKAMEDTAFYRWHRLISLNDVGGDPRRFGLSVAGFHESNMRRLDKTPHTMLATSTHDSKRSEDVRARIDVLSEGPSAWQAAVTRWSTLLRHEGPDAGAPLDAGTEYLLYQTLVGVWPLESPDASAREVLAERVRQALLKSVREAKLHTGWLSADPTYEATLQRFVSRLFATPGFLDDFSRWIAPIAAFGAWNSLTQVALKAMSPGVPDIYQGSETWNFSLVDPDNRRPVDFGKLASLLGEARALAERGVPDAEVGAALRDGRLKMLVTSQLLGLRRSDPTLFRDGGYSPLAVDGPAAAHVVAFMRRSGDRVVVVIGTRLLATLCDHDPAGLVAARWHGTRVSLPGVEETRWRDALTGRGLAPESTRGGAIALDRVLSAWPLAVLVQDAPPSPSAPAAKP